MFKKSGIQMERKNVTLRDNVVHDLETISSYTGRTQSDILELAMSQPAIRRMEAYINSENEPGGCIGGLIREYTSSCPSRDITIAILEAIKLRFLPGAVIGSDPESNRWHCLAKLVSAHILDDTAEACPELYYFKRKACEYEAHVDEGASNPLIASEDNPTEKIVAYIDAILAHRNDLRVILDNVLLIFLPLWLDVAFERPTDAQKKDMYVYLDRHGVFGRAPLSYDMDGAAPGTSEDVKEMISVLSEFAESPAKQTLRSFGVTAPSKDAVRSVHLCRLYAGLLSGQLINAANLVSKGFVMTGTAAEPLFEHLGLDADSPDVQKLNQALDQVHKAAMDICRRKEQ